MSHTIYTIGYATKPIETFIQQLKKYGITVVADIRSVPYSKVFHDFHRENIAVQLKKHHIRYVYLGDELGPRSKDDSHYDAAGQVQFDKLVKSPLFTQGTARLAEGLKKEFTIALMCAEKDPATCHRSLLVGYYLVRNGCPNTSSVSITHISHEGELETQQALEERLLQLHSEGQDLFMSESERKRMAYEKQLKLTSYRRDQ